jgi:hypothetical protein
MNVTVHEAFLLYQTNDENAKRTVNECFVTLNERFVNGERTLKGM